MERNKLWQKQWKKLRKGRKEKERKERNKERKKKRKRKKSKKENNNLPKYSLFLFHFFSFTLRIFDSFLYWKNLANHVSNYSLLKGQIWGQVTSKILKMKIFQKICAGGSRLRQTKERERNKNQKKLKGGINKRALLLALYFGWELMRVVESVRFQRALSHIVEFGISEGYVI